MSHRCLGPLGPLRALGSGAPAGGADAVFSVCSCSRSGSGGTPGTLHGTLPVGRPQCTHVFWGLVFLFVFVPFLLFVSFLSYSCLHRLPFLVNEKYESYQNHKRKKSLVFVAHRNDLDGHAGYTFLFSFLWEGLNLLFFPLKCIYSCILYIVPISHCGVAFLG